MYVTHESLYTPTKTTKEMKEEETVRPSTGKNVGAVHGVLRNIYSARGRSIGGVGPISGRWSQEPRHHLPMCLSWGPRTPEGREYGMGLLL